MTDPIYCGDCNAAVRLERTQSNSLKATCACDKTRNIRVKRVLPEGWE